MNWDLPKQTFFRESGQVGDCWRCCIAAMLQLPAQDVPHFLKEDYDDGNGGCAVDERTQAWLNIRGYFLVLAKKFIMPTMPGREEYPRIACGPTERSRGMGRHHAVVMIGAEVVYDPHPSNSGLTAITDEYLVVPFRSSVDSILVRRADQILDHHKTFFAEHGLESNGCTLEQCHEEALTKINELLSAAVSAAASCK